MFVAAPVGSDPLIPLSAVNEAMMASRLVVSMVFSVGLVLRGVCGEGKEVAKK